MKRTFTPRKSKAVLIVSNDQTSADLYREKLESEQYRVEIASDFRHALRVIEIDPVDLVIVDISKWGIHGVETIRSLHAQPRGKTVPVIALSNHYFGRQLQAAEEAGADRCVTKTICTPGQLATIVRATFVPDSPSSISLLPFPLSENAGVAASRPDDGELAFEAKVTRAFFEDAPATIARLRVSYRTFSQSAAEDQRLAALSEMQRGVAVLASSAGVAGFCKMAQLASALDGLLMQRPEEPATARCRMSRTIAQAVDLLAALLEKTTTSSPGAIAPSSSIAVVESETGSPETICAALAQAGLSAERLDQSDAVTQLLAQQRFDLIFIDLETPGLDGLCLCTDNRKRPLNRLTPVVFVTAQADLPTRARCTLSGGSDFISKPFAAAELAITALIWLFKERPVCPPLSAAMAVAEDSRAGASVAEATRCAVLHPWEHGDGSLPRASTG